MTLRLSGRLLCRDAKDILTVETYLPEHIRLTRAEPGCLSFDVQRSKDPAVWTVEEEFATRADFDVHQARTRASTWGRMTLEIPREYEISDS